jgi:hypothetical protein
MGSGASSISTGAGMTDKAQFFAYQVLASDLERYTTFRRECEEKDEEAYCEDELAYLASLPSVYEAAIVEYEREFHLCRKPAVILHKLALLTEEDMAEYMTRFIEVVEHEEKVKRKSKAAGAKAADYSQSFSGSAADTKAEKEAAALMRGDADEEEEVNPYLQPPSASTPREHALLRASGKWHKYMAASDCYMYVHSISREVLSMRPAEYEEAAVGADSDVAGDGGEAAAIDPANGLATCDAAGLPAEVERIQAAGETVLVLDTSEEQVAKTFYSYKAVFEDVSSLTIPFAKGGAKRGDLMERCRKALVGAMKAGTTFALYLGATTWEHADFKKKLCKKDVFPLDTFTDSGRKLLRPALNPKYKLIFREEDLEEGQAVVRDGFNVVIISSLDPHVYEEALESTLPLGYMQPIFLRV